MEKYNDGVEIYCAVSSQVEAEHIKNELIRFHQGIKNYYVWIEETKLLG